MHLTTQNSIGLRHNVLIGIPGKCNLELNARIDIAVEDTFFIILFTVFIFRFDLEVESETAFIDMEQRIFGHDHLPAAPRQC